MIEFHHVYKNYPHGIAALYDINIRINKGEFVFLLGPSGAGKSTFLNLIIAQELPSKGQVHVERKAVNRMKENEIAALRRKVSVIFQDFKLLYNRTVFENIAFPLFVCGYSSSEIKKKSMAALMQVGLKDKYNLNPRQLSGGEQQRVAIARCLAKEPEILLADEPTGNLDEERSLEILNLILDINLKGTTVIMATHSKSLVKLAKKRTIFINQGKIIKDIPIKNLEAELK